MLVRRMLSRNTACLCTCVFVGTAFGSFQTADIYQQATQAIQNGGADEAVSILNSALGKSPHDIKALNLLGVALMTSGRRTEAESAFKKALEVSPTFIPVLKNMALNEFALAKQAEAETHFNRVLQLSSQDPLAHLYLAEIAFSRKQFSRALPLYEGAAGLEAQDPLTALHFAETLLNLNQPQKAEKLLKSIPSTAPAAIHFQAGVLFSTFKNYAAAASEFELAKDGYPDPYQVGFNLVLTHEKARNFERAIYAGGELLSKGYRKAELFNLLATAYEQSGQTQKAYDSLKTATEIDRSDESNYLDLIALAVQHKDMDLALNICDIALNNVPGSYRLAVAKGAALALAGRPSDAEAVFLKATQSGPRENTPYIALAMVQIQSGKLTEAIDLLRSRKALSPESYLVNLYLGEALSRKGVPPNTKEDSEADQALRYAERANPGSAAPHALRGKLLFARGDLPNAAHEFEQALQLNPRDSAPAYQLSLIYRKQGDNDKADAMLNLFQKNKQADKNEALDSNLLDVLRDSVR